MKKFKGYDVVDKYPEDGWLKGYFYANEEDLKRGKAYGAYRDLAYIRGKDYVLNLLDVKKDEKVLDMGCADGAMMVYCGLLGAEVYGIDISPDGIKKANQYLEKYNLKGKATVSDATKIDFPENYFDKVVSSDFFEHLSYDENVLSLKEIKRVLRPGGRLVIKTPNLTYVKFSKLYKMAARAMRFKNPFDVIVPHTTGDNPQHIGLATRKEVIRAIKAAGFLNFRFYYDMNSKVERCSHFWGEIFAETAFLRDIFTENLTVVIYKPVILSLFKD